MRVLEMRIQTCNETIAGGLAEAYQAHDHLSLNVDDNSNKSTYGSSTAACSMEMPGGSMPSIRIIYIMLNTVAGIRVASLLSFGDLLSAPLPHFVLRQARLLPLTIGFATPRCVCPLPTGVRAPRWCPTNT